MSATKSKEETRNAFIRNKGQIQLLQGNYDTPGSPEGNTEGPGTASSEPLLPS